MKRNLAILFSVMLIAAVGCKDKQAEQDLANAKKEMATKDSLCNADKQMLMDSIMMLNTQLHDAMMMKGSSSSSGSKTDNKTPNTEPKKTKVTQDQTKSVINSSNKKKGN